MVTQREVSSLAKGSDLIRDIEPWKILKMDWEGPAGACKKPGKRLVSLKENLLLPIPKVIQSKLNKGSFVPS